MVILNTYQSEKDQSLTILGHMNQGSKRGSKSMNPLTSFNTALLERIYHGMSCAWMIEMEASSSALEQEELGLTTSNSNYNEKQTNRVT